MPEFIDEQHSDLSDLLERAEHGDADAVADLVSVLYPELKRLAHFQLAAERPDHTLNTTAIVHEAYLRMTSAGGAWKDKQHLMRAAATVMRHLLVDHARRKRSQKRGNGQANLTLDETRVAVNDDGPAVLALNHALQRIAAIDPRLERIIECRYFAGMSVKETAEALGMALRTVERDCQRAKAYLMDIIEADGQ